ncbi:hypothetical protein, partial [Xanthomonas euvesicatoria]
MSAHAHTGGMTRRRLLHAGALAGVAAGGGGGGGGGAPPPGAALVDGCAIAVARRGHAHSVRVRAPSASRT